MGTIQTFLNFFFFQVVETLAKLHIVMEYAGGGELFTRISNEGKLPEPEARHIFSQVCAAMEHMVSILNTRHLSIGLLILDLQDYIQTFP